MGRERHGMERKGTFYSPVEVEHDKVVHRKCHGRERNGNEGHGSEGTGTDWRGTDRLGKEGTGPQRQYSKPLGVTNVYTLNRKQVDNGNPS